MNDNLGTILQDTKVLLEVGDAMAQHIDTHGVQVLFDGTGLYKVPGIAGKRNVARARMFALERDGKTTWADVLSARHIEVMAEDDPAALRDQLLQLAAAAGLWVSDLDRRHADDTAYAEARISRVIVTPSQEIS